MSPVAARRWARLSTSAALAVSLGALLTTGYLLLSPFAWTPPRIEAQPALGSPQAPGRTVSLSDLAVIWQRDLRQPVVDPPAKPTEAAPEPKLAIRLVGTAVEAEQQYGLFQLANNVTVVRPAGAKLEGFEIVSIERGRARLRSGSREYELKVPAYDRLPRSDAPHGH